MWSDSFGFTSVSQFVDIIGKHTLCFFACERVLGIHGKTLIWTHDLIKGVFTLQ